MSTSHEVAATRSRRRKVALLAALLAQLDEHELRIATGYLSGYLPQGRIGIGQAMVSAHFGGGGAVKSTLSLRDLDERLSAVAAITGSGSQERRAQALSALAAASTPAERDFLAGLLTGGLRQGALEGVMADAIAQAFGLDADLVRRATMLSGDLTEVAHLARHRDAQALAAIRLRLMKPLQPMLAGTGADIDDVLARLDEPLFEAKLDGARVQIHRQGGKTRIFSRQLNDVTAALPEIVDLVDRLPADGIVLEGEAIAFRADGRPRPFQDTMKRFGRRVDVAALRERLPIGLFAFDCLHVDGHDLIDRPLHERLDALDALLPAEARITRRRCRHRGEVEAFMDEVLGAGHEGLMAKEAHAPYSAGRRGSAWLKLKPAYTADLVVLGCEWGSGRRSGMLSNLRLGARLPSGGFAMVGKTFKGLSDEVLRWQTANLPAVAVGEDALGLELSPRVVYEIAFDGVQRSAQYPAGIALRFARYRRRRDDKSPETATTTEELRALLPPN